MAAKTVLVVGTKKGLFLFSSRDRKKWERHGPYLEGEEVHHAIWDARSGLLHATANDAWFGSELMRSSDRGANWKAAKRNPSFAENSGHRVERLWHVEASTPAESKVLYAGSAPAALFRSEDNGETWSEVTGLSRHPTRGRWQPGAGGLCLHSIVVDPGNTQRMFVGISAVGVFRTEDGGKTWATANRGTRAEFLPDKRPEFGQCVHKLLAAPSNPQLLFQQNHCGVYRSVNGGEFWDEITAGLPSEFGFPLGIHPRDPDTIFVIPLQGPSFRCPPEGKLRVYRTRNGGKTWTGLARGFPAEGAYTGVYREGMTIDSATPAGIYFGTNTGKIYASIDEGDTWSVLADHLPPVFSLSAAIWE